jgi:transposase
MLSKEEFIVLRHYLGEGVSKAAVARKLGVSRMTVYRHASSHKKEPCYGPRPRKPSLLDAYKDYLRGRLELYPELSAVRLLAEITESGYTGKYTMVKDYVRLLRRKAPVALERRFDVSPGEQAQVDFATFKTPFGTVHALLVVLSWSRHLRVRFYCHQDQLTVLGGLHRAFVGFGGVPRTVLFDRMRAAVAGSGENGQAVFSAEMLRFASHYGFRPRACRPYRAKTKGRVERAVSYLRRSFFYGRLFRDLEDLNTQLERWLEETANARVHGTTGEVPSERLKQETSHLKSLPRDAYVPVVTLGRRVSRDGFIAYNGNEYSVPDGLDRMEVEVRATLEEVHLFQGGKTLAIHPVLEGRGQRRLHPEHRCHSRPDFKDRDVISWGIGETVEVQRRPLEIYEGVLR